MFSEGIGFDSDDDKVICSSVGTFRLYSLDEDDLTSGATVVPTVGPLVSEGGWVAGIHVDAGRNRIYGGVMDFTGASTGAFVMFDNGDLTFEKITRIPGIVGINDVYVGDDDRVYGTDHTNGAIYTCDIDLDSCRLVVTHSLLALSNAAGANGLVQIDDYLVVSNYDAGILVRIPLNSDGSLNGSVTQVTISDPSNLLFHTDGLVRFDDNSFGLVSGQNVSLVTSTDDWVSGTIQSTVNVAAYGDASTGAIADGEHNMYITFPDFGV
jgi:hypothetical protein